MPSLTPTSEFVAATSLAPVPLPVIIAEVLVAMTPLTETTTEAAPCVEAIVTQISSIVMSLLPHLPPITKTTEIMFTSVTLPSELVTSSLPSTKETEADNFADDLLQYAIKYFFSFFDYCISAIFK